MGPLGRRKQSVGINGLDEPARPVDGMGRITERTAARRVKEGLQHGHR